MCKHIRAITVSLIVLLFIFSLETTSAATSALQSTATTVLLGQENIHFVEQLYELPKCSVQINADSTLIAIEDYGVYDFDTGEHLYDIEDEVLNEVQFSPDGLLLVDISGVRDAKTGNLLFVTGGQNAQFSHDSRLVAVAFDGVYNIETGEKLFAIAGDSQGYLETDMTFSLDDAYLAVEGDGVYTLPSGRFLSDLHGSASFSPDSSIIGIRGGGAYDLETWEQIDTPCCGNFSPDGKWQHFDQTVYEMTADGAQPHFDVGPNPSIFSPDSSLLAVRFIGVFNVVSGQKLYNFTNTSHRSLPMFSKDGTLLVVPGVGVLEPRTGEILLSLPNELHNEHSQPLFSPDNTRLVYQETSGCYVYGVTE